MRLERKVQERFMAQIKGGDRTGEKIISARRRFLNQMQNRALKPLAGSICPDIDFEDRRQSVEDRTAEVWIASHKTAHKSRGFAATSYSQRSQIAIHQLLHDLRAEF